MITLHVKKKNFHVRKNFYLKKNKKRFCSNLNKFELSAFLKANLKKF